VPQDAIAIINALHAPQIATVIIFPPEITMEIAVAQMKQNTVEFPVETAILRKDFAGKPELTVAVVTAVDHVLRLQIAKGKAIKLESGVI